MLKEDRRRALLATQLQRMDLLVEYGERDPVTGAVAVRFLPDPRRYELRETDGRKLYVDRFTNVAFAVETVVEAFERRGAPVPMHSLPPLIDSARAYAAGRLTALRSELAGGPPQPAQPQPRSSHPFVHQVDRDVAFVSVDVVGATAMRMGDPISFDRSFEILVRELGTVVGHFSGSVLKATGDGFIAYVDQETILARDNAVDMALSMLALMREAVNPALEGAGLPPLQIRVGADQGPARIRTIPLPTGFAFADVVSDALNRAVKLQEGAPPGGLLIGESLRDQLHVGWMERAEPVDVGIAAAVGLPGYRSFVVE